MYFVPRYCIFVLGCSLIINVRGEVKNNELNQYYKYLELTSYLDAKTLYNGAKCLILEFKIYLFMLNLALE